MKLSLHICILLSLSGIVFPISAQELWLRPEKYFYEPGEEAVVQIQSGENFMGEPRLLESNAFSVLEHWNRLGNMSILGQYKKEDKASIRVRLQREGYHFVFLKTLQSYNLEGETFTEYLQQYSLDEILSEREQNGRPNERVKLSLTHHVQLALRTGKNDGKGWNKTLALPIEIVPDKNPQTLRKGDRIHFTILENGKPAFGIRVKIWNRWDNRTTIQNIYTEKDGVVSTTISNPGDWMVSVVKLRKTAESDDYVGEHFALNFGYR